MSRFPFPDSHGLKAVVSGALATHNERPDLDIAQEIRLMIHVLATIQLQAGKRDEFLGHFHRLVPLVRAEQGCIEYGPHVDLETTIAAQGETRANVVTVVEKWDTLEDLEAHLIAPHMLEYRSTVKALVEGVQLQILEPAPQG